ncbi:MULTISPECIES: VOC family protein [Brevibacterium]|uniref:VOC family protein n=1 Tax=Brevibacterium casei TaxID=33889 RepID=A0A7T4DKR6_9MICO|nr:VOC family protein [Brevibacterium casei]QQB15034.1 VOC family protein [Brevibacterium casei]
MKAQWISIPVDDQARALDFYTDKLGFQLKFDVPVGDARWLTVVSPEDPEGVEIVLEPKGHPAAGDYTAALMADGIPINQFAVDDVEAEYQRLSALGVEFTQKPLSMGPITTAVLNDTVGNLVQLIHQED